MKNIETITSRDNRRLTHARKVRDGKIEDLIFIEGRRLADEAVRSDLVIKECFVSEDYAAREILDLLSRRGASIAELPDRIFGTIADTKQPQGIILIAERPKGSLTLIESCLQNPTVPMVIFLKEINNPSNLGAILRSAEAAGVAGVILSIDSADVFSPKALRASMGSAFRLPIMEGADFENTLLWAKISRLTTTATVASAETSYIDADWRTSRLLIFGSEARGLSDAEIENVDQAIGIPMENNVESLNLAVSAGVILFEAKRQMANG